MFVCFGFVVCECLCKQLSDEFVYSKRECVYVLLLQILA